MMQTYSPDRHPTPISISVVCNTTDTNEMGNAADEVSVCESFIRYDYSGTYIAYYITIILLSQK